MNLIELYGFPPPGGASVWDLLGTEPGLTRHGGDGSHTIAQDFGPRDGCWVALVNDTGDRVYVYGHPEHDALDIALETPVARRPRQVTADNLDGDVAAPAPNYKFGRRYAVADEDIEEAREDDYHVSGDGEVYDLGTGYGPAWVKEIPPAGAVARLICTYLAREPEVEVEDCREGTEVHIGGLTLTAPRLTLGNEYTVRTINAFVEYLTSEAYEFDSADHYPSPDRAKYSPTWLIMEAAAHDGFWRWFRRALGAYGFDDFVVRSNSTHITFYSDGATCSGSGQEDGGYPPS